MRRSAAVVLFALFGILGWSQEKDEKVDIFVSGLGAAAPVAQSLIGKIDSSKPLQAVGQKDPSKVAVLVSCMDRKQTDAFACLYVSHYNGPSFRTFMGAGLFVSKTADEMATNFLGAIVQDILERYEDSDKSNLRGALEACLFLTDSKCNVPDPLQKELNAKQLTLGQYLLKKGRR